MKSETWVKLVSVVGILGIFAIVSLVVIMPRSRATAAKASERIVYEVPTPAPVEVFWVNSAGMIGMRGVEAVVPGLPTKDQNLSESCRAAATKNGENTLTICPAPEVGKVLARKLGGDR